MIKKFWKEIVSVIALVILILIISDFWGFYMSNMMLATVAVIIIGLYVALQIFVFKNKPQDEREEKIENMIGRVAYLSGSAILLVGLFVQSFHHQTDIWIVLALIVMILSKVFGVIYSDRNL